MLHYFAGLDKQPTYHPEIEKAMDGVKFIADHFKEDNRIIQASAILSFLLAVQNIRKIQVVVLDNMVAFIIK